MYRKNIVKQVNKLKRERKIERQQNDATNTQHLNQNQ